MFSVPSQFRLALIPLSVLLAYGSTVHAQQAQQTQEEADKTKQKQTAPAKPAATPAAPTGAVQKVQISGEFRMRYRGIDNAGDIGPSKDDFTLRWHQLLLCLRTAGSPEGGQ